MSIAIVNWPADQDRLHDLREQGVARLVIVGEHDEPPRTRDALEDWVRVPALDSDVQARVATLELRAASAHEVPEIDPDGLLRFRGRIVVLSPVELRLAQALVDGFGIIVSCETLAHAGWPEGVPSEHSFRVGIARLRQRLAPLGLRITALRPGRGYLLTDVHLHSALTLD